MKKWEKIAEAVHWFTKTDISDEKAFAKHTNTIMQAAIAHANYLFEKEIKK